VNLGPPVPGGAPTNLGHKIIGLLSGVGTKLNLGDTCPAQSIDKKFCRAHPLFGSTSTISRFGSGSG